MSRRDTLKLLSGAALMALAGCTRKPERRIVSIHDAPEYQKPGKALHYATTWTDGHVPYGLMVKAQDGRPVKIEGLPGHPLNDGRSTAAMQASLLSLYDPERLRSPFVDGEPATWDVADERVVTALRDSKRSVLVTRPLLGPSEREIVKRFLDAVPGAIHLVHATADDRARRSAWAVLYGRSCQVIPDLSQADIVLSLDCDFLGTDGDVLKATREFAARRGPETAGGKPNRLYVAEAAMTVTGSNADHRIPLGPRALLGFVNAIREGVEGSSDLDEAARRLGVGAKLLRALVDDLRKARGRAVVLAGGHLPEAVHARVAQLNRALDAPIRLNPEPPTRTPDSSAELDAAFAKPPDVAIFLGVNPVYDAPGGGFSARLAKAKLSVAHGLTANETVSASAVRLPSAHNLESWNDATPVAGVTSVVQPLISPLFDGRQGAASLLAWTKALTPDDEAWEGVEDWHDFVRLRWGSALLGGPEPERWEAALRKGYVGNPALVDVPTTSTAVIDRVVAGDDSPAFDAEALDLVLLPHPTVGDGRDAGNGWLQELPDPVSRLVWDNAVAVGPATAKRLGVSEGSLLMIEANGVEVKLPVLVQPGTAKGVLVATLGQGRAAGAGLGAGVGVNAAPLLRKGPVPRVSFGVKATRVGGSHKLVRTQHNQDAKGLFSQARRTLAIAGSAELKKHRDHLPHDPKQLHDEYDYSKGHKWAMAIDLSKCTGCGACVVACQSENNIFVVGKDEVALGREMQWIRIDRYESGDPENPTVTQQPMTCQHCDNAPCENVCPVNATAHSPEGLNEQVYNRCVGTRYCANNCPYKVRRFNFYNYAKEHVKDATGELLYNPNVTVRMRGVMEKCTFCVQRINAAKFKRANAGEDVQDGDVVTACQQACPAGAIFFGDVNHVDGVVAAKRDSDFAYHVLEELNVRPNLAYLACMRNPNEDAEEGSSK